MDYVYTDKCQGISGMGGDYEEACRTMVIAGMKHMEANPMSEPDISTYKNLYGIIKENNDDAKALSKAVSDACEDCTGAMHQAAMSHVIYAHTSGWDKYITEMEKTEGEK